MKIFFLHDKFLHGKFPQHIPLLSTPPQTKNPPENVLHFQIALLIGFTKWLSHTFDRMILTKRAGEEA